MQDMRREDKLAFFINLYNMMAIHAILVWGHPDGAIERRKLFGDFKYVIGGSAYSLSDIQNGILRGNQRPPYNLMKPFNPKDKRAMVRSYKCFSVFGLYLYLLHWGCFSWKLLPDKFCISYLYVIYMEEQYFCVLAYFYLGLYLF